MGPTASGKSALALDLARYFDVEIVSVDSAQVYRFMDIGTAKPDLLTRSRVPHHLIDLIEPTQRYSAATFRNNALAAIEQIAARGRTPLLVGGTMLYFKALRDGLSTLPEADPELRAAIASEASARGWAALYFDLARVDPVTAKRLNVNDRQRIERALEVYRLTGVPMSRLLERSRSVDQRQRPCRYIPIALMPNDRALLHERIAHRFDDMLAKGLVPELADLRQRHALFPDLPSMRTVGYRQAWQFLEGEIDRGALRERGIYATRQLAKRQLTWLRGTEARRFDCFHRSCAVEVARYLGDALASR